MNGKAVTLLVMGLLASHAVAASWRINGFVNQAAISTTDNYFFGNTDDQVSFDYRELALIGAVALTDSVDVAGQVLSRKAGVASDGTPALDYGFVSWRFFETYSVTQGLRLGRFKAPIGFYNDTRESPFTRNGIFLPQSIYLDRGRNYMMRADELMYFGEWRAEEWTLNWKLAGGKSIPDKKELVDVFHLPDSVHPRLKSANAWHFQLLSEYDGGRIRLGFSTYRTPNNYSLDLDFVHLGHVDAEAVSLWRIYSFEYNAAAWSFTTEYEQAEFNYNGSSPDPANPNYKDYPEAGYAQLLWHVTPSSDLFVRREFMYFNKNDPDGSYNATLLGAVVTGTTALDRYGFSSMLGWVFRPAQDWLIRAELYHNRGDVWVTQRDAPDHFKLVKDWNMAAVAVSWRF
ncbi:MAG TPA: hypothetical protein VFM46_16990 [Pseudomonadales bacterium]|nr:hypothetical protein [Pseudomonadales bacterium]